MWGILSLVTGIGSLVCWIMTLIKMFQSDNGILKGILGIICGLWAFIWGWMNVGETGHKTIMLIWTLCIILGIVANVAGGGFSGGGGFATP